MKRALLPLVAGLLLILPEARADVRLNSLFADHMVIQRDKPIRVWGWADPGEEVKVTLGEKTAATKAGADGRWSVELPALAKGEDLELTVAGKNPSPPPGSAAASTVTLKDVIVGDVWICSGQSNMGVRLQGCEGFADDLKSADLPKIRHLWVNQVAHSFFEEYNTPVAQPWQVCSPKTAGDFTAIGFYFAREVHAKTGVPIGLINSSRGGTNMHMWFPPEAAAAYPYENRIKNTVAGTAGEVQKYLKNQAQMALWLAKARQAIKDGKLPNSDGVKDPPAPSVSYKSLEEWERWLPLAEAALKKGQLVDEAGKRLPFPSKLVVKWGPDKSVIEPIDSGAMDPGPAPCWWWAAEACCLYRGMVSPLTRLPMKGVLWYQGESDAWRKGGDPHYAAKQKLLVEGWRKAWGQGDFPFYYVQIADLTLKEFPNTPAGGEGWTNVRDAQLRCMNMPNTGMAVIIDTGHTGLHPTDKFDVGDRLARWALARDYGFKAVVPSGPIYKEMKVEGDKARLSFDYAEGGLMVGLKKGRAPVVEDKAGKLKWFAIAGADRKWVWAEAVVDGKTVVVSSPEVKEPAAVRYAYIQDPAGANLYNRDGLPASPFRTDNW